VTVDSFRPLRFGRYTLVERIAIGGMAEIFKAKTHGAHGFEKTLVVKRILPHLAEDSEFVDMFVDEAKVMVQVNHPKVVQVMDFGEVDGNYYIAMEYVSGLDGLALLRICARRRCRPVTGIAVHVMADVLDALDYVHNLRDSAGQPLGIVHHDISPSNIFISDLGEVKLGDFGIARAESRRRREETGTLRGKYGYMSPEVVSGGEVDHRSDLFSVGVVLAELLMIRRLFLADNDLEVLLQVRDARLGRLDKYGSHIPADLRGIIVSALARDPSTRYQDAASFRDALHRYLFEEKKMVRATDLRQFLKRLREMEDKEGATAMGPPPPFHIVARRAEAEASPVAAPPGPDQQGVGATRAPRFPFGLAARAVTGPMRPAAPRAAALDETWPRHPPGGLMGDVGFPPPSLEALAAKLQAWPSEPPSIVGRKRRIVLGPPPKAEPVPAALPEATDRARPATEDMVTTVGSEEVTSSQDFRRADSRVVQPPPLEQAGTPTEPAQVAASRSVAAQSSTPPDLQGDLERHSLFKVLFRLAAAEESGLLVLRHENHVKEVYLVDGDPQYVTSNLPDELFGQYLVQKGVLSQGELSMALAMLPRFEGKLGTALVALKLLRPVQVLRHLTYQVRQKLLNAFGWDAGTFAYHRGRICEVEAAPLGLEAFEVVGAGVLSLPQLVLIRRLQTLMEKRLRSVSPPPVPPEAFRLGMRPRQVYDLLDGRAALADELRQFDDDGERDTFARLAYLFVETGLAVPA
jgi:hypothetical protein